MLKLALLDRDGILNKELGNYVTNPNDFEVLPYVIDNLVRLQSAGYQFVVITNQGGVAKQLYSHQELTTIHQKLRNTLSEAGIRLLEIYYCPHHPSIGTCLCRKPNSLMIEKAIARFGVKPENVCMIGDAQRDIEAASTVGIRSYLVPSNTNWDWVVDELIRM